ncbi:MAG: hypothetical protein JXJ04_16035, partial [Spirochaetales bacterium]|nr:hypothetical protein [Spirochaetales bacterium]
MKKGSVVLLIAGSLFLLFSLVETFLCFYGPIVLDVKSTVFVFPLYTPEQTPETGRINEYFLQELSKSRKYIVIDEAYAQSKLTDQGKSLREIIKRPSITRYAEAAKKIGADKFIMGYILKNADGYELFINIFITNIEESVIKEKCISPDSAGILENMSGLIKKLDGGERSYSLDEILYFYALLFYALFGLFLIFLFIFPDFFSGSKKISRISLSVLSRIPELLFILTLLLFVYAFIYALNANMDYVQKFIATGGKLHLAQSTTRERINTGLRYIPLLGLSGFFFVFIRMKPVIPGLPKIGSTDFRIVWALPLTLISALFASLSLPSFLDINGWPVLGFLSLIPFFLVIEKNSYSASVFYGIIFGTFNTVFTSYWLGTFSLVSLQIVMVIFLFSYVLFMMPAVWLYKRSGMFRFLVFPIAWVAFDFLQSIGFAGYPWGMIGVSQYSFLPLIQISAITGVWGVTFLVILVNAVLAHSIDAWITHKPKQILFPLSMTAFIFIVVLIGGLYYLNIKEKDLTHQ